MAESKKVQCPSCGRHFSEKLVSFPVFFDDKDETMVYDICPICLYERRSKSSKSEGADLSFTEFSYGFYKKALVELKNSKENKKPAPKKDIKWKKLVKLTPEEYEAVTKRHPELLGK